MAHKTAPRLFWDYLKIHCLAACVKSRLSPSTNTSEKAQVWLEKLIFLPPSESCARGFCAGPVTREAASCAMTPLAASGNVGLPIPHTEPSTI